MLNNLNIKASLSLWRYWTYKAIVAYRLRYKNSKLGIVWPSLSLLTVTIVIGIVWGTLLKKESLFVYSLYVMSGYSVWTLLSGSIEQGCRDFNRKESGGLPLFSQILERFFTLIINFSHLIPILFICIIVSHVGSYSHLALLPGALIAVSFWMVGIISLLVALISVLPDLKYFILSIMRVAFLATPIIWETHRLGAYEKYIWLNPFYIPLESLRFALSGIGGNSDLLWLLPLYAGLCFIIGIFFLNKLFKKLGQ